MPEAPERDVDLDEERKRFILEMHSRLPTLTHYEVLGIAPASDKRAVKRAYFELVRTMHPDRYFGKHLGEYRAKMEAIFARLTTAYETLSNAERRAEYDRAHAAVPRPSSGMQRAIDPKVVRERQAAMDALRARFTEKKSQGHQHAAAGDRARAAGDLSAALTAYKAALACAPGDRTFQTAHDDIEREMASRLVASHRKKAEMEERFGRWDAAAISWRVVVDANPADTDAQAHLREALAKAGRRV